MSINLRTIDVNRIGKYTTSLDHPIFIVGTPRSGTTLLAAMLSGHSRIACGPETQFFSKINARNLHDAICDRNWPRKAVELIESLTLANQKVHKLFNQSLEEIGSFLSNRDPSIKAMLESLTESYSRKSGKKRWAEKTPNHLLYLREIRTEFPRSPIIRIVRDARDSGMSMRKLPWASESMLANCYLCNEWFERSKEFFKHDNNTLTLRYEDLVSKPINEIKNVCEFIGEKFEQNMLNTDKSANNVLSPNEPWKAEVSGPLVQTRIYVWKNTLSPSLQDAATLCCLPIIQEFGYESSQYRSHTLQVYPLDRSIIENYEEIFINAARHRIRLIQSQTPITSKILMVIPNLKIPFREYRVSIQFIILLLVRRIIGLKTIYSPLSLKKVDGALNLKVAKAINIFCKECSWQRVLMAKSVPGIR